MSDVGDAIELTYTTAPGATVVMSWIHIPSGTTFKEDVTVPELTANGVGTGQYPITLVGTLAGMYEAVFSSSGTATAKESYYERFEPVGSTPPLATLGEYTDLYGSLSLARAATCRALLKRASRLVRDTYPSLGDRITAGTVSADSAGLAVLNMVARVMRNPGGLRSETTGPFSRAYDPDAASGMLQITEAETGLLGGPASSRNARGRMGSIRVRGGLVPSARTNTGPLVYGPKGQ